MSGELGHRPELGATDHTVARELSDVGDGMPTVSSPPQWTPMPRLTLNTAAPQSFQDIYSHVEQHASPHLVGDRAFLASRAWDEGMRMMEDDLRRRGVTGREHGVAMGDWSDQLYRDALDANPRYRVPYSASERGLRYPRSPLYRGDQRPPHEVFLHGFEPRGTNEDFDDHLVGDSTSNYVSTSTDAAHANDHTGVDERGYVYIIEDAPGGIDVNLWYASKDQPVAADELEIAFKGGVPANKIKGVLIDPTDPSAGFTPNPHFQPTNWDDSGT
ncbi:hypothetical protein [Nocardia sp. NPDC051463]|uniref:scabin-related ADP-ribosyltransferase n=1 Tax=Nocardia sp. NPDC051463 TaxID=3154845 RepID=UPI003450592F